MDFADIQAVICDMDGVLWRGATPLAGMREFFELLHQYHLPFMLATNNSSRSPAQYVDKIKGLGVDNISTGNIINSGLATAHFLLQEYPLGADIHVIGGRGLHTVIIDAGFSVVEKDAQVVVVGLDTEMTYERIKRAVLEIRGGARFIGTNPDVTFPSEEGLAPGAGSLLAMIEAATDVTPEIVGKPFAPMFDYALKTLGSSPQATLMIGDRLSTDIVGGRQAGLQTALVFTGVTTADDLIDSEIQPDVAYEDLLSLIKAWDYEGGKRRR